MAKFSFNPHRHAKIWFSKDPNSFLNPENQLRFVAMREKNKKDEVHFIYDSKLLSGKARGELSDFCKRHNIIAKDVWSEIFPHCVTPAAKNLVKLYKTEVGMLGRGGNVAVLSDIVRWLEPVSKLGVYSDFDTEIATSKLPETIEVESSLLLNLSFVPVPGSTLKSPFLSTDIISVVDPVAAAPLVKAIQEEIYRNCCVQPFGQSPSMKYHMINLEAMQKAGVVVSEAMKEISMETEALHEMSQGYTSCEVRQMILDFTASNDKFLPHIGPMAADTIKQQDREARLKAAKTPEEMKKVKKAFPHTDEQALTERRKVVRNKLLRASVLDTTGPTAVAAVIYPASVYSTDKLPMVARRSLAHYGLSKEFSSEGNALPLYLSQEEWMAHKSKPVGEACDLSWIESGERAAKLREVRINSATRTIQRFFKTVHANSVAEEASVNKSEKKDIGM